MAKRTRTLTPMASGPAKPAGRQHRPGIIYSSLHPPEAFLGEAAGMVDLPSRRAVLRTTAEFALAGPLLKGYATSARAKEPTGLGVGTSPQIDSVSALQRLRNKYRASWHWLRPIMASNMRACSASVGFRGQP